LCLINLKKIYYVKLKFFIEKGRMVRALGGSKVIIEEVIGTAETARAN
jgi:hypothetical protein